MFGSIKCFALSRIDKVRIQACCPAWSLCWDWQDLSAGTLSPHPAGGRDERTGMRRLPRRWKTSCCLTRRQMRRQSRQFITLSLLSLTRAVVSGAIRTRAYRMDSHNKHERLRILRGTALSQSSRISAGTTTDWTLGTCKWNGLYSVGNGIKSAAAAAARDRDGRKEGMLDCSS